MYKHPLLFVAHILFWFLYASFEHLSHLLYGANHWQGSLLSALFIAVATALLALLYQRIERQYVKSLVLFFFSFSTLVIWHNLTRILHFHVTLDELFQAPFLSWLEGSSYRLLLLITWGGMFASAYHYLEKRAQMAELSRIKSAAKEAQLQQLMSQLNPHFLFNVLNSIDVAILENDNQIAHRMVLKLCQFLRSSLEIKFQNKIQLQQEVELLDNFIDIEKQRFHQDLNVNYNIATAALHAYVPPLIFQPLIENAIKFSWRSGMTSVIEFTAEIKNQQLVVQIKNTHDDNVNHQKGTNSGLENVERRLSLLYADEASLQTINESGVFIVIVTLPIEVAA